jgi:tetratricopeptide (TPR) repeat protein
VTGTCKEGKTLSKKRKNRQGKQTPEAKGGSRVPLHSISDMMSYAFQCHRAGALQQAESLYRQVLQRDPGHADALHLLGLIAHQVGRHDLALIYIGKAIAVNPSNWVFHNNLGEVYRTLGHLDEAAESHQLALRLNPSAAEVYNSLGSVCHMQGKCTEAIAHYHQALHLNPNSAAACNNLGAVLRDQGRLDEALEHFQRALQLDPNFAEAYTNIGLVLRDQGQLDAAVRSFQQALRLRPDLPEAHANLGLAFRDLGQDEAAVHSLQRAVQLKSDFAEAHANLGLALRAQGRLSEAAASLRRAVQLKPDFAEAYHGLGRVLQEQGKLDDAIAHYQRALQLDPDFVEVYHGLGYAFQEQGKFDEAMAHYQRAVQLKPDFAEVYHSMGHLCQTQGKLDEAVDHYQQALRLKPDFAEVYSNLGAVFRSQGRFEEAVTSYRQALQYKPDFAEALSNLGNVLQAQGKISEAIGYYQRALQLRPDFAEVYNNLGTAQQEQGRIGVAMVNFQRALQLKPDYAEALSNLGSVLEIRGQHEEAKAHFRRAQQLKPAFVEALVGEINGLEREGNFEQAYARLRPFIEAGVDNPAVIGAYATLCRRLDRRSEAREVLEQRLAYGKLSASERRNLLFGLGQVCDELGEYDQAFAYCQQANALKPHHFDPRQHAAFIDALIATYNADFLRRMPRATHRSERPVFIVGMPRSGTSLVEQILASHPAVFGAGELRDIPQIVASLPASLGTLRQYPHCLELLTQEVVDAQAQRYLDQLARLAHDASRVTDKLPGNFQHLGLIALLFPQARVIHCLRDPLDTCLSCYFLDFTAQHPYAYDLTHLGLYYRHYQRLMRHWRGVLDVALLEVQYEDLTAHQEEVSRQMVDFCGLEWDDRCLRFHETKRLVYTASYDQVRRPMYTKSRGRHRHYEHHLGPLKAALAGDVSY